MGFTVIRAGNRGRTTTAWLTSHHSFSFGDHYDPSNTHHGSLIAFNEDSLLPGHGFSSHRHQESEIVTWVVSGSLVHEDSAGHSGVVYPGLAQRMSAGVGVDHTEANSRWPDLPESGVEPAHYIQMWVTPDQHGIAPSYAQADISDQLATGELVTVASGDPNLTAAISLANSRATLFAARPAAGSTLVLPSARFVHVFVVTGQLSITDAEGNEHLLGPSDAARGVDTGGELATAVSTEPATAVSTEPATAVSTEPATAVEVLIWAMDAALGEI